MQEYIQIKKQADDYKKQVDKLNAQIKSIMEQEGLEVVINGTDKISKVVQERQSLNEERLIPIAHEFGVTEIIKTKEYIDTDVLEKMIYNEQLDNSFLDELEDCIDIKHVVTLRIGKVKEGEE